ncbi:glycosyltransferase family 2 protein [Phaeobacter sp. QD34_3]|uniref:glycosyltransferase family 2 protein n=1 Tax=unclassified Phaeobacter TaxID=2621772 RepID=UPI00237F5669|nr:MULTISPECIES: glycosyltransferase family 2 protein [unclassified Phaeobacter]MDE4133619.1 glycosyltransferase family 2 protein [Phaeobacter sp. QD34_3]MDE4137255.1 glycosyltransferase family 2 protein [Phaeobacter sp. QD34_24]
MRFLAILSVRNEAAFLLEWLAHHRAVGFTDFLVFSNDCQDGTDRMLDRLDRLGHLTHLRNEGPYGKGGIQFNAMKLADKHRLVRRADWIMALDVDEFVNIHAGRGTLPDLLQALPEADAITLTWRLFGNGETLRYEDRPVTDSFTRCAPNVIHWPWRAAMFKTLYRNDGTYRKTGVHRPRGVQSDADLARFRWFDCEGRELGEQFKTQRLYSDYGQPNHRLAQLNHYPLGAMESYIVKADRGRAVHSDQMLDVDYWVERNFNTDEDTSIARYAGARDAIRAMLQEDQKLARLHEEAVAWRHQRFRELMLEDPFRALFSRLLMTPPSRPINAVTAQTLTGFALLGRKADALRSGESAPEPPE